MKIYEFYEDKDNYYIITKISIKMIYLVNYLFKYIYQWFKDSFHPEEMNINF